jgi:hypothetical protein
LEAGVAEREPFAVVAEAVVAAQQPRDHAERLVLAVALHHRVDAERACVGCQRAGSGTEHRPAPAHVVELHDALGDVERVVVGQAGDPGPQHDVVGVLCRTGEEHLGRGDHLPARRVVLATPELVESEAVEVRGELDVALELQRGVFPGRVVRGEKGAEAETGHAAMVRSAEIVVATGRCACNDLAMAEIELRAPTSGDIAAISAVVDAQDIAWWGAPDGDIDDLRHELDRVRQAMGSLEAGARVALVHGEIVGVALAVGHGHTSVAVATTDAEASSVRRALFEWLVDTGEVQIESPSQDTERLSDLAAIGFVSTRSSFELERPGDTAASRRRRGPRGSSPFRSVSGSTTRNSTR